MNKKYIISGIVGAILLSFTTAFALTITKPTITDPVFKAVYIGGPAHQSALCESSSGTLCMDQVGFYRNEIPGANSNILKWNNGKISIGGLTTADIPDNIINSTHIFNTTILPGDFDINYQNFRIPTAGEFARTTGNCGPGRAATGMNAGVMRCVSVDFLTGLALPNCGPMGSGYTLTFTGNQWVCLSNVVNVLGADGGDTNWSGATTGDIRNRNTGNVGVGLTNPSEKLTVQDSFSVNGGGGGSTPEMIYCHKTNTWVNKSSYIEDDCAVCPSEYTYNAGNKLCEKTTSTYVSEPQKIFSSTIGFPSCGAANGKTYYNWDSVPKDQLCTNGEPLVNSGLAIMGGDNEGKFEWGCYLVDPNRATDSRREDNRYEIQDCSLTLQSGTKNIDYSIPMCNDVRALTGPGYYDCIVGYITLSNYQNGAYDRGCRTGDLEVKCNFVRGRNSAGLLCPAGTFLDDKNITINEFYPTSPSSPFPVPNKLSYCYYDNNYPRTFKCRRPKDDPIFDSIATEFGKNLKPYYIDDIYYYRSATQGNIWSYLKLDPVAETGTSWSPYFSTWDGSPSGDPSYERYNRISKRWIPISEWNKYITYITDGDEVIMSTSYKDAYCSGTTNKWFASYALNTDGYAGNDKFLYEGGSCSVVGSKKSCYSQRDQYRRGVAGSEVACCYNGEAQCQFWQTVSPNSADVRVCAPGRDEYVYTTTTSPADVCDPSNPLDSVCFTPAIEGSATTLLVKDGRVAINSDDVDSSDVDSSGTSLTGTNISCRTNSDCGDNTCNGYIPATGTTQTAQGIFYEGNDIRVTDGTTTYIMADRNLGASVAGITSASYGSYFQRGNNNGFANVGTITPNRKTPVNTDGLNTYTNGTWIYEPSWNLPRGDWSLNQNDDLRPAGGQGPCPSGYHLPTRTERKVLINTWVKIYSGDAMYTSSKGNLFRDTLKLPMAGIRVYDSAGSVYDQGDYGIYWSSTPFGKDAYHMFFYSSYVDDTSNYDNRAYGHSVRCFKDPFYTPETLGTCTTTTTGTALLVNGTGGVRATTMINYSDVRIKTNIQKINNALADITRLNGYEFTWIESGKPDFGVLAQEVEKVFASIVSEDSKGIKAVNYTELLAPIIEAIHEINTRVDELTREAQEQALRIETLEK